MRCRLVALYLIAVLLTTSGLDAAPVPPEPYAILDVGPPFKGVSVEKHLKTEIERLTIAGGTAAYTRDDPEVQKLESVQGLKDLRAWLAKNMRVTKDEGDSHLQLKFAAGYRAEQIIILNATMRAYLQVVSNRIRLLEQFIAKEKDPNQLAKLQAELTRYKAIRVVRWAK